MNTVYRDDVPHSRLKQSQTYQTFYITELGRMAQYNRNICLLSTSFCTVLDQTPWSHAELQVMVIGVLLAMQGLRGSMRLVPPIFRLASGSKGLLGLGP